MLTGTSLVQTLRNVAIFTQFGINGKYNVDHERGVCVGQPYSNSNEFLRGEIGAENYIPDPRLVDVDAYLEDWWKPKAVKRYLKLSESGQLDDSDLWHWDLNSQDLESWLTTTAH